LRSKIINQIFNYAKESNAFDLLEKSLKGLSQDILKENIIECGILPEMFDHDSSEEKLWAKYSDIILSFALSFLGIKSRVLGARGNAADVFGETSSYTLVADAKTFRLSRTAKNQKDFKVGALDSWREASNYALLVSPLVQYPTRKSQIYKQAIERNVTLISYTHLYFLLEHYHGGDLSYIWDTGNRLKNDLPETLHSSSLKYWNGIDEAVCKVLSKPKNELITIKELEITKTKEIGLEGINFWENKIKEFSKLSKEEAIKLLIKSYKIEAKISTIKKMITKEIIYE
jgi:hypothetical protein